MLPSFFAKTKTSLIAGVTAVAVLAASGSPALAWGKKEQQFVAGAVTALALSALLAHPPRAYGQPQYQQPPRYYRPRPVYQPPVYRPPVYQPPVYQPPVYQPPVYHPPVYQPASIYGTPIGRAFNSYTSNERMRIQSTLTAYGYYHSSIDGSFGPGTYGALDSYARATGKTSLLASSSGSYGLLDGLLF